MSKRILHIAFPLAALVIAFLLFTHTSNKPQSENDEGSNGNIKENEELETGYAAEAAKWYYDQRAFPLGYIPNDWRNKAYKHIASFNQPNAMAKTTQSLTWTSLGPWNIGGRVRAIVVDPTDPNTVYIGSVSGGVWKTTNGGSSWLPLDDQMANLAVCSMVMDPKDPKTIYAGTGEGFNNYDAMQGAGIFKTTDAGSTWSQLPSTNNTNFYYVNRLAIDSSNGALYAATLYGLFKSTDGGDSFTNPIPSKYGQIGNMGSCADVVISYTSPTTIFASFGLFLQSQIWRSNDGGKTFQFNYQKLANGRIELASSPSDPLTVYASFMNLNSNEIDSLCVTNDGGNTWITKIVPGPNSEGTPSYTANQGWYNNAMTVDPDNAGTIYVAGIDTWKSLNYGINWTQISNAYASKSSLPSVHSDIHTLVFAPSNHNIIYLGCDGGVYNSTDRGKTWTGMNNNLAITQFYSGAVSPVFNSTTYYGGAQDNYTLMSSSNGQWRLIMGGDGGDVNVDFSNPNNVYAERPNFTFLKSIKAGNGFSYAQTGIPINSSTHETTDRTLFITPFSMDPNNSQILVAGTYRIYRTTNAAGNWTSISPDLSGDGYSKVSAVTVAKGNSKIIYAAYTNGKIWVTQQADTNWTEIDQISTNGTPLAYCTSLATNPTDDGTVYATYSGYFARDKVFKSTNYGQTWTNVSGNLPNIPVQCLVVNPNNLQNLIIGTDLGIFTSFDGGKSWTQDNSGLANVAVFDLDYRASDNTIFAATHGRGMFSAPLTVTGVQNTNSNIPTTFHVFQNYPNPFNPSTIIQYSLPQANKVKIVVYDISGKEIAILADNFQNAGTYNVTWTGKNNSGQQVASGIYFYSVQAGNFSQTNKMVLLK